MTVVLKAGLKVCPATTIVMFGAVVGRDSGSIYDGAFATRAAERAVSFFPAVARWCGAVAFVFIVQQFLVVPGYN